ncbi:MAG TPA: hypothetical protein VNZ84_06105, partial [Methylophilus sp.]|nr:hypothetical protein [Methylophilus sp.]
MESQKLQLEIQNLKKAQEKSESRILIATTEETKEYNQPAFSRTGAYQDDYANFSAGNSSKSRASKTPLLDYGIMV